jgi:cytochrome c oxidase subunit 2
MKATQQFVCAAVAASLLALPTGALAQDDRRGELLFGLCTQCHGTAGEGMSFALAPTIAGLGQWYIESQLKSFKAGLRGLHAEDVGGLRMYPMSLSLRNDEDIEAVAAYVASLPRANPPAELEGGDATKGAASYATCTACHGPDGAGNKDLNAPALAGGSDWYLYEQLKKFKAGVRGGNPQNQNAVMMRGMAMSLADDQAMRDVVAYIMTLGN